MKKLIKDQGIKPEKIDAHLNAKKNPKPQQIEIKKELIKIKDIIKKSSKVQINQQNNYQVRRYYEEIMNKILESGANFKLTLSNSL